MATLITASIRIVDTRARCPHVVRRHSIISRRMRPGTVAATWSQHQATAGAENTRCPGSAVVDGARQESVDRRSRFPIKRTSVKLTGDVMKLKSIRQATVRAAALGLCWVALASAPAARA